MRDGKIDKQKYNELVKRINIVQINLIKINAEKYFLKNKVVNTDVNINNKSYIREISEEHFIIDFETNISSKPCDNESLFDINIKYELVYSIEGGIDTKEYNDVIEFFAFRNVPVNIWPYIRELVSETTARMGFPPLVLKPLKVF